jgi:molecular chaperone DnaJ
MNRSYYAILGISSTASPEEIRSAYRRLAKEYHPDHYQGGSGPFREIQEAYYFLGDAQRRNQYKQTFESSPPVRPARPGFYPSPEPLVPESPVDLRGPCTITSSTPPITPYDDIFEWFWTKFY